MSYGQPSEDFEWYLVGNTMGFFQIQGAGIDQA